jgi:hypothetical protein
MNHLIEVGAFDRKPPMALAHEFGHVLAVEYWKAKDPRQTYEWEMIALYGSRRLKCQLIKHELMAWRLAKTFMKPSLWSDMEVLTCLYSYATTLNVQIHWNRLEILPITGFKHA